MAVPDRRIFVSRACPLYEKPSPLLSGIGKALDMAAGYKGTSLQSLDFSASEAVHFIPFISVKEDKVSWGNFFQWLRGCGLDGVKLVVGDKHPGMLEAVEEVFPETKYHRCTLCPKQFSLSTNPTAFSAVPDAVRSESFLSRLLEKHLLL